MKKKKKIIIIVLIVLLLVGCSSGFVWFKFFRNKEEVITAPSIKVMNEISEYGYTLEDRDTELFKEKYEELKELLNSENYESKDYAELVAELFIIDLYTINNKVSKYDVGGLEYVYEPARDSFKSVVMDTIYKTVVNNIDKKRTQNLPVVESINVLNVSDDMYELPNGSNVTAFLVNLNWNYETDLDYDSAGTVTLILNNKKIDVVSFSPEA